MNSPETPVQATPLSAFAPLPLRARGSMEVLDTGVRVYKQYFWTLFSWAAIVSAVGAIPFLSTLAMFMEPLATGACVCCIAAAVRGQALSFKQCGDFSKSRYGPMLGMYILSVLIFIGIIVVCAIVAGLGIAGGIALRDSTAGVVTMIILGIIAGVGFIFIVSCTAIWMVFVQIVVCMEEDKRGTPALRRAYDLLRGHWVRVSVLVTLLGLACLVLLAVVCAAGALLLGFNAIGDLIQQKAVGNTYWGLQIVWILSIMVVTALFKPLYYVTLSLFYLDLRIRKEALDLQWTAHQTTPAEALASGHQAPGVWAPGSAGTGGFVAAPGETGAGNEWYNAVPAGQAPPVPNLHGAGPGPIAPRLICSHCGASVPAAEACSNCGSPLPVAAVAQVNATTPADWSGASVPAQPEAVDVATPAPLEPGAVNATTPGEWTGSAPAVAPADTAAPPTPQNWNDPSTPQP